jgi:hypothetical protein
LANHNATGITGGAKEIELRRWRWHKQEAVVGASEKSGSGHRQAVRRGSCAPKEKSLVIQ